MKRQGKRIGLAWLLLSVFVSMLLLSGLHRHEAVVSADIDCMECVHHVHHSGHLSTTVDHLDDCLLCQFLSFVYTAAATTLLLPLVIFAQNRRCFLNSKIKSGEPSVLFTRGPPSVL
jgi:hypothetical protein